MKDGTEKDQSIRVNVVGNFRQGKTSLTKRLLGKRMRDIKSTNGIEIGRYVCERTQSGKYTYRRLDDKDFDIVGRLVSVALSKENEGKQQDDDHDLVQLSLSESLHQVTALNVQQPKQKINSGKKKIDQQMEYLKPDKVTCSKQSSIDGKSYTLNRAANDSCEKIEKNKKVTGLSEKEISSFTKAIYKKSSRSHTHLQTAFDIWDFGGQYIFYATHTIFHSRRAIYLLVFDLSIGLKHIVVDEEFPSESGSRSVEYFLQFWMQSIHSFVGTTDGSQPKVILVGTHKDKIKGNTDQKQAYIKNYFDDIKKLFEGTVLLNHLHPHVFAIDNNDPKDMSIATLREAITKVAEEETSILEVPAKWIHLEKNMKERNHMRILSLKFIMAIDGENEYPLGDLEQVKLFLRYHHVKGTFVYFDEEPISEYVVLDPQYLVDAFKSIITSERFCSFDTDIRPLWKKLMTEARLEKCLVERQWGKVCNKEKLFLQYKDILLAFLTKHHVIAEATTFDETTNISSGLGWYIVPSLLREQSNEEELQEFLQGKQHTLVTFVMSFGNSQIVATIYHRYIAALIAKWSTVSANGKSFIFTDLCVVRLDANHAGIAKHKMSGIELAVVNLCPSLRVNSIQSDLFRRFSEAVIVCEFGKLRDKKDVTRPYKLEFRCNHASHRGNGSDNSDSITSLDNTKIVPCPDLQAHDLNAFDAKAEWFADFGNIDNVPKLRMNDKLISKISNCIGENWQILGHELDLNHVQIEHISEDHPNNTLMKIYHMLKKWSHKMSKKATLDILVQAMRNCPTLSVQWDGIKNIIDGII